LQGEYFVKIVTVMGARPQFIKAAAVSREIAKHPEIKEIIVHTGQHYDDNMSQVFFEELAIPVPDYNLGIGSGPHGAQTGAMLEKIETVLLSEKPDWILVYGDTNSTLAGALAAAKLHIPVAHVEAGLRSFNKRMPEEINRILTDHVSSILFCPTHAAYENLRKEGVANGVYHVGDVMYDAALIFAESAERKSTILLDLGLKHKEYLLTTVHRAENTDDPVRLQNIITSFCELGRSQTIIFPVHPRTRGKMAGLSVSSVGIRLLDPVSFLDMVHLEKHARCILTDSGGVQKEAYFHGVPCITLRDETEWVETVRYGWNQISGTSPERVIQAVDTASKGKPIPDYGIGKTSEDIVQVFFEVSNKANGCIEHAGS
jgi:UDP-GlcNAc3NAcA epimerase